MKIRKSQKRNKKSYFVTLSVSDYDIEMLEDLGTCYCNVGANDYPSNLVDLQPKYSKWLLKTFYELKKLWKKYD